MELVDARSLWHPEPGWLNTATYGLPPRPAWEELQSALADWRLGRGDWSVWETSVGRARRAFAALTGVPPADVATGASTSAMLAPLAAALPAGARVVVPEREFGSALYPWLAQADRGVDVRTVPLDRLVEALGQGADLVAFSLVQSADGTVVDLARVVAAARAQDALVVVDATQACGWLPFDATEADVVVVSGYKWLMAARGVAFGYLGARARDRMRPSAANRYATADPSTGFYGPSLELADDARRFDLSPAWFSWVAAAPAMELLVDIGLPAVRAHDVGLANRFLTGVGLPPGDSAIVTVDAPDAAARLTAAGIRTAVRDGRVRASFHLYTTVEDVDRAVAALTA
jgi:selenocysteine lyase/cysteine desulfurase